jgi:nicotinate-nucleotide adenylyltransferase
MMKNIQFHDRVAIYGGSFNPVHIGHLLTGFDLIDKAGFDHVVYIPANMPVHKDFSDAAPASDRLAMVQLCTALCDSFSCLDIEIERGGNSYTIDTVREIITMFQLKKKPAVILGDDLLDTLPSWKAIDDLRDISELVCLHRESSNNIDSEIPVTRVKNRIIDISSTEIRDRLRKNLQIDFMVPEKVNEYLKRKRLYI